jgi:dipeptidyl aminopeptidase/acylaminoacyl peptidase
VRRGRLRLRACALLLGAVMIVPAGATPAIAATPNDELAGAETITALPYAAEQSTAEATASALDPDLTGPACPRGVHATVWYRYTAQQSGPVRLDTLDSDYDTVLAVFTEGPSGLEQVACNNTGGWRMQARATVDMTADTTYVVMVGATEGTVAANLRLTVEASTLPPLAVSVSVRRATPLVPSAGEVQLSGTATCSRPAAIMVSGTVEQGGSFTSVSRRIDCPGSAVDWTARTRDRQGPPLQAGTAQATLVAISFDEHGDADAEVAQTLRVHGPLIAFARSVSKGGHDPFRTEIFTVAEGGTGRTRLTRNSVEDNHPAFSPDGQRIAFTSARRGSPSIYVMNVDGSRVRRLTFGGKTDAMPDWSPNGKWIVFTRHHAKQRQTELMRVRVDDRATRRITRTKARELRPSWSPDGKLIAFTKLLDAQDRYGIAVIRPNGKGARWLTRNPRSRAGLIDDAPTWSPTGSHVAFARETSRRAGDLYTVRRNGTGVRRLTAVGGAAQQPSWGADGRIAFVHNGGLAAVDADGTGLRTIIADAAAASRPYAFPDWARTVNL